MKQFATAALLWVTLVALPLSSGAADPMSKPGPAPEFPGNTPQTGDEETMRPYASIWRGKVLNINEPIFTIETGPGTQADIRTGKLTKFENAYKAMPGDWIEANVTQDGSVLWMKKSIPAYSLEGDLLKLDRDAFMLKDVKGKEIRLQFGNDSKVEGSHTVGERVRVEYTPDGKVLAVTPVKAMRGGCCEG